MPEQTPSTPSDEPEQTSAAPPKPRTTRRTVVSLMVVGAGGAAIGVGGGAALRFSRQPPAPGKWRYLTEDEAKLLAEVCEQIIPADQDPGAKDAGCVEFIDKQLTGHLARFAPQYREGLRSLQATAQKLKGKKFEELNFDEQTELLKLVEGGKVPSELWTDPKPGAFFTLVIQHTMMGFYGHPKHGGNKDWVSYKMLGLAAPAVIGRNRPAV